MEPSQSTSSSLARVVPTVEYAKCNPLSDLAWKQWKGKGKELVPHLNHDLPPRQNSQPSRLLQGIPEGMNFLISHFRVTSPMSFVCVAERK